MALFVICLMVSLGGCSLEPERLLNSTNTAGEEKLFKAEIVFSGDDKVVAYIKSLGVQKDGEVYVGGASLSYLYDARGNIIGSYNYQKVEYIKIISEKNKEK